MIKSPWCWAVKILLVTLSINVIALKLIHYVTKEVDILQSRNNTVTYAKSSAKTSLRGWKFYSNF
jgi:hypothetical protein